jgi:hypothetical protein
MAKIIHEKEEKNLRKFIFKELDVLSGWLQTAPEASNKDPRKIKCIDNFDKIFLIFCPL